MNGAEFGELKAGVCRKLCKVKHMGKLVLNLPPYQLLCRKHVRQTSAAVFIWGVWKSGNPESGIRNPESGIRNPESGIGTGIGTGTGTGTGIGTGMGRETYIKAGTTFTLI